MFDKNSEMRGDNRGAASMRAMRKKREKETTKRKENRARSAASVKDDSRSVRAWNAGWFAL